MKLFIFELKKLFSKKLYLICLILFLIANAFVLLYTLSNDFETSVIRKNLTEYEQLISQLNSLPRSDAKQELASMQKTVEIALLLDSPAEKEDKAFLSNFEDILNQYKLQAPREYEQAQRLNLSRQQLLDKNSCLENLDKQMKYISSYDSFISEMSERSDKQLKFSIFANKGTFSYNNIKKTPSDFVELKNISLEIGNNTAVETSTTFTLTDMLVFALIFLMCIYLFTFERDKGLYQLVRSMKKGRLPLIISKLAVLLILTFLLSVLYYLSGIFVCGFYSGFGDLSRNIQSIGLFQNCSYNLSVCQYLVLWVLSKVVTMCVIALLLALVFVLIKNSSVIYPVIAGIILLQYIMFSTIGSNAPFNQLKYINLFYFLNGNSVFGDYLNINFFSYPINITVVYFFTVIILFFSATVVICLAFVKQSQQSAKNALSPIFESLTARLGRIRGSVALYSGECFKHYKGSMAIISVILLCFTAYQTITDDISPAFSSAQESAYNAYLNNLEGELTAEKEMFLTQEQAYFDSLNQQLSDISADTSLSADEIQMKQTAITAVLETKGAAFAEVSAQADYIRKTGESLGITPEFINKTVYRRLVENPQRQWQYITLLLAVIIFACSNVFAYEHKKGMANLIRCTRKGKLRTVVTKITVALLTVIISYTLIYLPYYINFIITFGTASLNSPIVFMQDFENINSTITINQMIFLTSAVIITASVTAVMAVTMLSQLLKSNIITMTAGSVLLLIPCLLCRNQHQIRLYTAFQTGAYHYLLPIFAVLCVLISTVCFLTTLLSFSKISIKQFIGISNDHNKICTEYNVIV